MQKKLNVLFLSSWYPSRVAPRLGNFVEKHAEAVALKANVYALHVSSDSNCKNKFETDVKTLNGVYTVVIYYKKVEKSIPLLSAIQKANRFFVSYIKGLKLIFSKESNIDIVHHNVIYPVGIIAFLVKFFYGIPYLITEHSTAYLSVKKIKFSLSQKLISKLIVNHAACITPVSENLRDSIIKHGFNSTYEIVNNVVDTKLFTPNFDRKPNGKIKFIHISTLDDHHKNISGMLRVAENLSRQRQDFEIWFVGDGDTLPHIKTAEKLNIANVFAFFDGTKTTLEVAQIMHQSDCLLLFSNYENFPCVIVEALAAGIPILSSDVGGIAEHVNDENGMLVMAKDEVGLLNTVNSMIDKIKLSPYSKEELSKYAQDNFSYESVGKKFLEIYYKIVDV